MKLLLKSSRELCDAGRWDIDFHSPAEGILRFPKGLLKRVDEVAEVVNDKRDPTKAPDVVFQYIDISSVDVAIGVISNAQHVQGSEAPSRARKVVRAFDLVVSTCRPTRGAIAVVPVRLHNQIASTGFSILRAHRDVNPFYLQYALRLPSTLEQFRKWSTGSSYPAILDNDVRKTVVPVPPAEEQDFIAAEIVSGLRERAKAVHTANSCWVRTVAKITASLCGRDLNGDVSVVEGEPDAFSLAEIHTILDDLPLIATDRSRSKRSAPVGWEFGGSAMQ